MAAVINPAIPSGPYSATWGTTGGNETAIRDCGLFEGAIRWQQNPIGLPVRASQWGQTIIDYVMQGGGYFAVIVVKEWATGSKRFMWPFGTTHGIFNEPGRLFSSYTDQLVLTALAGTPAATYGPVTRTVDHCAVLPGHNLDITMGPMERNVVVALAVLPQPATVGSRKALFCVDT